MSDPTRQKIDELQQRIATLKQLRDDLIARAGQDLTINEYLEPAKAKANVKIQALEAELSASKAEATLAELDVKGILDQIDKAQAFIDGIEGHDESDPRFAGTATLLASAYGVVVEKPGTTPLVFEGRPFADACRDFSGVRFLFNHEQNIPLGPIKKLWETDAGLLAKVGFSRTPKGEEIAQLARDGALREASIQFTVKESRNEKRPGVGLVRVVTKADLQDVSVVTWGANPKAKIMEAASRKAVMETWQADVEAAERQLRRLSGDPDSEPKVSDSHFDWIRGREITSEEHEAQQRNARHERLCRAIAKDPSIAKMPVAALDAYLDAIEV